MIDLQHLTRRRNLKRKMPKINELLKEWKSENPPYAFEFYPPRSKEAVEKLYERLVRNVDVSDVSDVSYAHYHTRTGKYGRCKSDVC